MPQDTATISVTTPFSFNRTASSTAISSNGFIDILTFAMSMPDASGLTRTLTLKSMTRLTQTIIFMSRSLNYSNQLINLLLILKQEAPLVLAGPLKDHIRNDKAIRPRGGKFFSN